MAALISITDVKPLLNVRDSNPSQDTKITGLINAATSLIEAECRQKFTYSSRTEFQTARRNSFLTYDFRGNSVDGLMQFTTDQFVVLRSSPMDVSVTPQVWYDPLRQFDPVLSLIDPSYIFVDPDPMNARIIVNYPTDQVLYGLKVQYSAGFQIGQDNTLSADLQANAPDLWQAAILTVVHLWNRTNPDLVGSNEASESGKSRWNTVNSFGVPKEAQVMLKPYRRVLTGRN